jgi:hypothetical protein
VDGFSLAGFQVITYGRFWVITEEQEFREEAEIEVAGSFARLTGGSWRVVQKIHLIG